MRQGVDEPVVLYNVACFYTGLGESERVAERDEVVARVALGLLELGRDLLVVLQALPGVGVVPPADGDVLAGGAVPAALPATI